MATGKRYYWIKLKDSFFSDDGPVDFMMSQPDGANYVVLYQMLCLKTINTGGRLSNQIGEVIIPYDHEKIRRTCKYFTVDTIRIALNLYKALGLIYEDINGALVIAEHSSLVGSETDYASKKKRQRLKKRHTPALKSGDIDGDTYGDADRDAGGDTYGDADRDAGGDTYGDAGGDAGGDTYGDAGGDAGGDTYGDAGGDIVPIEIRDKEIKRIEIRDKVSLSKTYIPRAGAREDGLTDEKKADDEKELSEILEACNLEIFSAEKKEVFVDAIERLYYSESVRIGKAVLPQSRVRSRLHLLNEIILQDVESKMKSNTETKVKNPTAYMMSLIYNAIAESQSEVMLDPYLNGM